MHSHVMTRSTCLHSDQSWRNVPVHAGGLQCHWQVRQLAHCLAANIFYHLDAVMQAGNFGFCISTCAPSGYLQQPQQPSMLSLPIRLHSLLCGH